jgi:signal transduction histidine kinase
MRERTAMLHGKLDIETHPGKTEIRVRVPIGGNRRRNQR